MSSIHKHWETSRYNTVTTSFHMQLQLFFYYLFSLYLVHICMELTGSQPAQPEEVSNVLALKSGYR